MKYIITGGHSGMGLELTKKLLNEGHRIGLVVRNESRKKEAQKEFGKDATIDIFIGDLSNRNQIKQVTDEIKNSWNRIDGIFNNAGVLLEKLYLSDYGNEMQLEVNAISPYLFTKALKPLLDKSAKPFVVSTATTNLQKKSSIDIESFKKPTKFVKIFGSYMDSKLILVTLMNHLAKEWKNVRFVNVHPGAINTKMTRGKAIPMVMKWMMKWMTKAPIYGANNLYNGAFDSSIKGTGIYVVEGQVQSIKVEITPNEIDKLLS